MPVLSVCVVVSLPMIMTTTHDNNFNEHNNLEGVRFSEQVVMSTRRDTYKERVEKKKKNRIITFNLCD